MTELATPLMVRRTVSFGSAVLNPDGVTTVEGITARVASSADQIPQILQIGDIPVLAVTKDSGHEVWQDFAPDVVIDARMLKHNVDTRLDSAPFVIALGPGFTAGVDCHAVIETNRGHRLGRVIWNGEAEPNTGVPGNIMGKRGTRVLRAPCEGFTTSRFEIGDTIKAGEIVASVDDAPVEAPFDGVLRGLIHSSVHVWTGLKIGDLDPRGNREHCFTISDKSLAIGGAALEAILTRSMLPPQK
jgi:xanthine dehydrogenase accessory factor